MQGKELLKGFRNLPENEQNKILVDAYKQIAMAHDKGKALGVFSWRDCQLSDGTLTIEASVVDLLDDEIRQRNLRDYAAVIYCLITGNKSSESMDWEAGRKIKSAVLREIVLTICGHNESIDPLIKKLRQTYINEETFFDGYSTVDEKEGREAYEKQKQVEAQNRADEAAYATTFDSHTKRTWGTKIAIFLIPILCIGGYRAYKYNQEMKKQQSIEYMHQILEQNRQRRQNLRDVKVDIPFRAKKSDTDSTTVQEDKK